jgi:hypothetical protein
VVSAEEGNVADAAADTPPAPSVVLAIVPKAPAAPTSGKPLPTVPVAIPIVSKPLSKFTVTVEYLDLVAAPASETPAADAKPTP